MHRNLTSEVILKEDFLYCSEEALQTLISKGFHGSYQHFLEIKTFKKSDMNFYVMKSSSDLNCVQLVKLHLLKESEVAI